MLEDMKNLKNKPMNGLIFKIFQITLRVKSFTLKKGVLITLR